MPEWPHTIPHDLDILLEAHEVVDWEKPLRVWAKRHGLRIKLQWIQDLDRRLRELDEWRATPKNSDRWARIREWLIAYEVEAPERLPIRPEQPRAV
ncbi:hypothetical protein J7426_14245 [Tropicibacter sp. R16_0]|uniref:hypothetical protein n=1 Tax=Tropicibacter sp. R16_0 TaxID=2821102 RepID=UPI001ADAD0D7|nr:hypothetical protein [Tropicibacter sp. R16_0]MBO9451430.1 hypothetical protein [Tropicibacter sp. R16_0]